MLLLITNKKSPVNAKGNAQQRCMFESPVRTKSKLPILTTMFLLHSPERARRHDRSRSAVLGLGLKSQIFPTPLSFKPSALARGDSCGIYGKALRILKLESSRQPMVKIWWSLRRFWLIHLCDRQTERQTNMKNCDGYDTLQQLPLRVTRSGIRDDTPWQIKWKSLTLGDLEDRYALLYIAANGAREDLSCYWYKKSHIGFQMTWKSSTFNDLEGQYCNMNCIDCSVSSRARRFLLWEIFAKMRPIISLFIYTCLHDEASWNKCIEYTRASCLLHRRKKHSITL